MKLHTTLMASCALALIGTTALADCAADLARLQAEDTGAGQGEGISKDGSLAPLETAAANTAAASSDTAASDDTASSSEAAGEGIAKDGSLAPLEGTEAEAGTPRAMSGQDVQAQQEGEPTAAESAAGSAATADPAYGSASAEGATMGSSSRSALLAEAQAALDGGDDNACRAAVEKIEAL